MSLDFLREAFTKLNEETFDIDGDSLDNLDAFLEISDDEVDSEIPVIDETAKSEEELQNSYVGKVICECPICHSYIFKEKVDLVFDDDKGMVNVDDECPYCCEAGSGYTIVGEVKAFKRDDEEEADEEDEDKSEDEAEEKEEVEETEEEEVVEEEPVEESLETPKNLDSDKFTADENNQKQELVEEETNEKSDEIAKILNDCLGESAWSSADFDEETECLEVFKDEESIGKYNIVEGKLYDIKNQVIVEKCKNCDEDIDVEDKAEEARDNTPDRLNDEGKFVPDASGDNQEISEKCKDCNESIENGIDVEADDKVTPDELKPDKIVPDERSDGQDLKEEVDRVEITKENGNSIEVINDKDTNEVSVKSNDVTVKVSSDGEAEAVEEPAEVEVEVAPEADAEAGAEENAEVVAEYEGPENNDEVAELETSEEEEEDEAGAEAETEVEVKDIDLESFERIGNQYLKTVYENVESFATSNATLDNDNNKIILEGVITFKSGKSSPTKFVFESKDINASNKVRFVGTNEAISRGRRPFTMSGVINDGKYIVESMTYHYRAKSPSGKSVRVNGTIN